MRSDEIRLNEIEALLATAKSIAFAIEAKEGLMIREKIEDAARKVRSLRDALRKSS
ncbi:hypothetical protein [Limoniibacter endophyticus]|uniref:Uncharacterized protein n=1 Tax=Limoniibacter endophyticus TaxID=1565040 RepID=A0A8J3DL61_9HYPH|nr:hypothetical protein [Limoniibacter endophyticus]GHC78697.1 hypothetical protein GCM10010136_30650 [Limoniibacter endophyticus]